MANNDVKVIEECSLSKRADKRHGFVFDGDDPYVVCFFCGKKFDNLTGLEVGVPKDKPQPVLSTTVNDEMNRLRDALETVRGLLENMQEINPNNYSHEDVVSLNAKMVELFLYVESVEAIISKARE